MKKIQNLKMMISLEYHNIKIFLQKTIFQIGLEKFWGLKELKILCRGHMLFMILREKKPLDKIYVKWKGYDD